MSGVAGDDTYEAESVYDNSLHSFIASHIYSIDGDSTCDYGTSVKN